MEGTPRVRVLQMCAVDFTVRQFLLPLVDGLRKAGYDVSIACSRGQYFEEIAARGYRIIENPVSRSFSLPAHLAAIWRTYRLIRREKFDVVHVHTPIAALIGRIAAKLAGVSVKIYTAHGFYFHEGMSPAKRRFHIALEKLGAACGDFIFTVSAEDAESALRLGIVQSDAVETIYNGIDLQHFDPMRFSTVDRAQLRIKLGIPEQALVVGFVGRLVREKGIFELLHAVHELREEFPYLHLLVVGDTLASDHDGSKSEILETVKRLDLEKRAAFSGLVSDTSPYLAAMDIFALPSYREGMPVSLLEAMGMQLPCIATNIRGCREEIVDAESGILVPPRDASAVAGALRKLAANSSLREKLSRAARNRVEKHFEIQKVVSHQLEVYRLLTANLLNSAARRTGTKNEKRS